MAFLVILSSTALQELETSVDWYNERQEGLGERFIEAVDKKLTLLSDTPKMFPVKQFGYHEVGIEIFPYLIVYKIIDKEKKVRVLHIFHTKRDPRLKK